VIEAASHIYNRLSRGETLGSRYIPSFSRVDVNHTDEELISMEIDTIEELLRRTRDFVREEERARAKTLVGPHRDEIVLLIDGADARGYGSQGQQRTVALALKLAQLAVIQEIGGNQPLLLLDDVMSELDENRRASLIEAIDEQGQTVITATDLSCFNEDLLADAHIIDLGRRP
jgi:DNA replication and repair protein RecF